MSSPFTVPAPARPTGPGGLDSTKGVPLYVQLSDIFRYNVMSGAWQGGHRLKNFDQLADEYQVSRITVRQAVARLVREGILASHPGKGTTVLPGVARFEHRVPPGKPRKGEDLKIVVLSRRKVKQLPPEFQGGFQAFDAYVELTKVQVVRGIPYALIRIFVAQEVFDRLPRGAEERRKVLRLVLEHGGAASAYVRQHTTVEPADSVTAGHLNYSTGSPVARILRQAFGDDQRLSYAGISWYRGDCFEMDMTLPRDLVEESPLGLTTPGVRDG
jgi:GntR family transcriptional regulator